jgi:CRP/FNR family transcriptional regulator, anaerobic regulatory protein
MLKSSLIETWFRQFPALRTLSPDHQAILRERVAFPELEGGAVAYHEGWDCPNYVMCLEGGTRSFKTSASGRELLLYRVQPGSTCVFTTQCLLAGGTFPAESVAEAPTRFAALPAATFHELMGISPEFRRFVLDDYSTLLTSILSLVDEVAFSSLDQRLAQRLLAEADPTGLVSKTHQQLADDIGSVREVISRHLSEWERAGWIRTARGSLQIIDRQALAAYRGHKAG